MGTNRKGIKLSYAHKKNKSLASLGERHWNWKGGTYRGLKERLRKCFRYRSWRDDILLRDDYMCQKCGEKNGEMEVDHFPKTWHLLIKEFGISSFETAIDCDQLWNMNYGRTLCYKCHQETKWV